MKTRVLFLVFLIGGSIEAAEVKNAFIRAASSGNLNTGDETTIVLERPKAKTNVKLTARDGWRFSDGSTERTVEHNAGEIEEVPLEGKDGEESTVVTIEDDWQNRHTCKAKSVESHIQAPTLYSSEDMHYIQIYKAGERGVGALKYGGAAQPRTKGLHKIVTTYSSCEVPGCDNAGRKSSEDVEIEIDRDSIVKERPLLPPTATGFYPFGTYEVYLPFKWENPKCPAKACVVTTKVKSIIDVYEFKMDASRWIGLDRTDAGRANKKNLSASAAVRAKWPSGSRISWSFSPNLVQESSEDRRSSMYHPKDWEKPSSTFGEERISCAIVLSNEYGASAQSEIVTNATIVKVDVELRMDDIQDKEANEANEETKGAFVRWMEQPGDDDVLPVKFTVEPSDLPADEWFDLTFCADELYEVKEGKAGRVYESAAKSYRWKDLRRKSFVLSGRRHSDEIADHFLELVHRSSGAKDRANYTVVEMNLVPDFARKHRIDAQDERDVAAGRVFHWWINDDNDYGNCGYHIADAGGDIPAMKEKKGNCSDDEVNGRSDLVDFFPLWTKIGHALELVRKNKELAIFIEAKGVGYVPTKLTTEKAGAFLTEDSESIRGFFARGNELLKNAEVETDVEKELREGYCKQITDRNSKQGILLVEGCTKSPRIVLKLCRKKKAVLSVAFKCKMHYVLEMMNRLNIYTENPVFEKCRVEDPQFATADTEVFFIHGFKVDEKNAMGWHAEVFKRLYQTGSEASFTGVTWPGIDKEAYFPGLSYHRNAYDAFSAGERLASFINASRKDAPDRFRSKSVVMAHSLGNMVASAAIQDYGLRPDHYFLLNAAVAAEAYDRRFYQPEMGFSMYLVNINWRRPKDSNRGYPLWSYCSEWYKNFLEDETELGQSLAKLTWQDRFGQVGNLTHAINYYSTGDEVFEICTADDFSQIKGFTIDLSWDCEEYIPGSFRLGSDAAQFCWQKQEAYKGKTRGNWMRDSDWGGYGFNPNKDSVLHEVRSKKAEWLHGHEDDASVRNQLLYAPVFGPLPDEVFGKNKCIVTQDKCNMMLAIAIPAISRAMGNETRTVGSIEGKNMFDFSHDWGRDDKKYKSRWLHCDIKDMAYFYTANLWKDFVENGKLK